MQQIGTTKRQMFDKLWKETLEPTMRSGSTSLISKVHVKTEMCRDFIREGVKEQCQLNM